MVKVDHLKRFMFRLHIDFEYIIMDDNHKRKQEEWYGNNEESLLTISSTLVFLN